MIKKLTLLAAMLAALSTLAACGGEGASHETHTAASGDEFNDADVEFATQMIQHHAEALAMVDLTRGRPLDQEIQILAEDILMAQGPEIERMVDWLTEWDQPIPATVRDHANAHGDMDTDSDMPGMMSAEQVDALEVASDEEFQRMWLEMMIEHHAGATDMARLEREEGHHPAAVKLATRIESTQEAEITHMQELLDS